MRAATQPPSPSPGSLSAETSATSARPGPMDE